MSDGIKKIQTDVMHRGVPNILSEEEAAAKTGGSLEGKIARAAGYNAAGVGVDLINAGASWGNMAEGVGQTAKGLLKTILHLGGAGIMSCGSAKDLVAKIADLDRGPERAKQRAQDLKNAQELLGRISDKDWPLVREGLTRFAKGVAFTVADLAQMPVNAAKALDEILAAGGVVLGKAMVAAGAAIGKGLYAAGVAVKDAAVWSAGQAWDGIQWTGKEIGKGAVAVKDGIVWTADKYVEGCEWLAKEQLREAKLIAAAAKKAGIAIKDGAVYVADKVSKGATWVGDLIREGIEDTFAAISNGASKAANAVANKSPRYDVDGRRLPDAPAHAK